MRNACRLLIEKKHEGRHHLGDTDVDGMIILKKAVNK
jgi:hypothetical protein